MSTYLCKCGQTFDKNTEASTTGRRMPDYGPSHECWGCPFVCRLVTRNYGDNGAQDVVAYECRGSKNLLYYSEARMSADDTRVGKIYSLDFDFLHAVRDFTDTLEGIEPHWYAFMGRPAEYAPDGRYMLSIYPKPNKAGQAAKGQILARFFNPDGSRKGMEPEAERELVLEQIRKAKEVTRIMEMNESCIVVEQELREAESGEKPAEDEDGQDPDQSCEWENASGGEGDGEESEEDEPEPPAITGERVSLRDYAFDSLVDACDSKINQALRFAVEAKQAFTFTAKITFEPRGGAFGVKHETGYQFDPIKVKSKGELFEETPIALDESGTPIIPYDREHQLTIDEATQRDAGATVVADESGVVQSVELDDQEGDPGDDEVEEDELPEDFCAENDEEL